MKKLLRKLIHPFYKRYHFWYHKKPRKFRYKKVYTMVQPSVFSPIHTISTKVFLEYIATLNLTRKNVLELGCGSGIISVYSTSKGAIVTASDINKVALKSLRNVSEQQKMNIQCIDSDLFTNIPYQSTLYDYIFINPPFYPKSPTNIEEHAWFCGKDFEYFEKLFSQLNEFITLDTIVLMILSNDCDMASIQKISSKHQINLKLIHSKKTSFEVNYIYTLTKKS